MNKFSTEDKSSKHMKKMKPDVYTPNKYLICDWVDRDKYLIKYRLLKFCVGHGMTVEKIREIKSFRQNNWLKKCFNFKTKKRN